MTEPEARKRLARAISAEGRPSSDYDLNAGVSLPDKRKLRDAAVLVGVHEVNGDPHVLLTKRSSRLKHHPGQIAFPGGKLDPTDPDATNAALREAEEEVGLPRSAVEILGTLPAHETVTGFTVTPVLGWIRDAFNPVPETGEVDEIFSVPLWHVTDISRFRVESRRWRGERRFYYVVPWGPYYIWGATARILRGLADRMST